MKKILFTVFILSIFGLLVNVVYAEDSAFPSNQTVGIANNDNSAEAGTNVIKISNRNLSSNLPFVLQQKYKVCIDKCSRAHSSCMNKVGGNPSAINNCDEQRWRCTLSCDDKYYGSSPIDSFDRF